MAMNGIVNVFRHDFCVFLILKLLTLEYRNALVKYEKSVLFLDTHIVMYNFMPIDNRNQDPVMRIPIQLSS